MNSFSLVLLSMMGIFCNANHQDALTSGSGVVTPDGNKECSYTKQYHHQVCEPRRAQGIFHNADAWYYVKYISSTSDLATCMGLVSADSGCTSTMISGDRCFCLRKGRECTRKASHKGNNIYTFSCSTTCKGKCEGTHTAKSYQYPGNCQGGVCKKNDGNCCEAKKCNGCDSDYFKLATQSPSGCNGHCPRNDGHCCAHKECSTCAAGWYAKSSPTPENCSGNCPHNSNQCCAKKTCGSCNGSKVAKTTQRPQDCSGSGNCYNNDNACCEPKVCLQCTGEWMPLKIQHPETCNGRCTENDTHCCRHAPKSLIHENTHLNDFDITELFELSFSFTPMETRSGKSNVLHLTETADGSGSGGQVPAVYMQSDTLKLEACAECDGNLNTCITSKALTLDVDYEVVIKMDEETFSIIIDGVQDASVACVAKYQPAADARAILWTSNPWDNAAFVHVEQVEYKSFLPVQDATVTGWQSVEYGMSCTSHRLLAGTGKTEAECKALCEANAMCHSIFFSDVGLRSCTLCSSYSPGPAIKLDTTTYIDPLNKYKMAQYRRPHIMDVQWYQHPVFSCEDEGWYDGLRLLTKTECLELAAVNGQNTLKQATYLRSGCAMNAEGEYFWADYDADFFPEISDIWTELLICKFEPENDGIELFSITASADFPGATDGDILTHSASKVDGDKNYVEIDIDGQLSLMKLWIAKASDNHVQHGHTAAHTGTEVTVLAYNGANYVPCATAKLNPRKQWTQVVCNSALYAEKIRIESTEHGFTVADTRIFGIEATSGTYLSDYSWTDQITDDWHRLDDVRGCVGAGETTSVGTYRSTTCKGTLSHCLEEGQSACNDEWKRCWGIGLQYNRRYRQTIIEYYDVQAMNPLKCSGIIGLTEDSIWTTYRRRSLQLYDVMVNVGPCYEFNWFTGVSWVDPDCNEPKTEAFAAEALAVLHTVHACTMKATVEEMRACYREMAAREVMGDRMFEVFADRKSETQDCVEDRRRASDSAALDTDLEEDKVNDKFIELLTMRRRLQAVDLSKYGGSKNRAFLAMVSKRNPHRDETRRVELEYEHFEPSSTYGEPWTRRRQSSESDQCWAQATMLNTVACENLKGAAEVTLEVMKSRRSIALDEVNLIHRQAGNSALGGIGGFIAGLAGGAATHAAGGPAGVAMGVASAFVGGITDLFCGFGDGVNAVSEATLAKRETRAMLREIGAQEMQALSDKVQVCDMPSTSDIKCLLGDLKEEITDQMREGFADLGSKVQNVLRVLEDNHVQVMREFLKVESILIGNTIALSNLRDSINVVIQQQKLNTNLLFNLDKLGAIEQAQHWYALWSEDDEKKRLANFRGVKGNFWCTDLIEVMGSTLLPRYIEEWVASPAFKALAKPVSCTPELYAAQYTYNHKAFESLFEFVAMMQLYINEYSESTVTVIDDVRLEMANTYKVNLKEIEAMTSC